MHVRGWSAWGNSGEEAGSRVSCRGEPRRAATSRGGEHSSIGHSVKSSVRRYGNLPDWRSAADFVAKVHRRPVRTGEGRCVFWGISTRITVSGRGPLLNGPAGTNCHQILEPRLSGRVLTTPVTARGSHFRLKPGGYAATKRSTRLPLLQLVLSIGGTLLDGIGTMIVMRTT
jgi:hypothetical protein